MNSINWPALHVWVFIAQLVENCSAKAEATGSNPFEVPKTFYQANSQLLKIAITTAMVTSSFHLFFRSSQFISFCVSLLSRGLMNIINWPDLHLWVFIVQLVKHLSANAEATCTNAI